MFIEQKEIFDIDVNFLIMMVKTINIHGNQHWLKALIINLHIATDMFGCNENIEF